jgi:predicted transcriptional regulator
MVGNPDGIPADALEEIAYLAKSANRLRLLGTLASGSYSRRELDELTGIARTTIGRIVNEFEERGWAERTPDGEYTTTPMGEQVVTEFTPLVESMEGIRKLGNLVTWIQAVERPLGIHHLSDATVRWIEQDDPMEVIDFFTDLMRDTSEFHTLNHLAPAVTVTKIVRDRLVADQLTATFVLTGELVDYIQGRPDRRERWRDCVAAGADVYRYDGAVPCNLILFDERGYIANSQAEYGDQYTMVESENTAVRAWAKEVIEVHKADSKPLDTGAFEDPTTAGNDR